MRPIKLNPSPELFARLSISSKLSGRSMNDEIEHLLGVALGTLSWRNCPQCGDTFSVGRGANRRSDAIFCCTEHKNTWFSLERSRR